jgi:hypothetical protein
LHEAETRERDESWQGPTLSELNALVQDPRRSVIHDEDDLFRLVLSSIERFTTRLHNIGYLLWNEAKEPDSNSIKWRPKYESEVADLLKDHLEQDLADHLIVNREVLVRRTTSKGHGLSVDVLASAGSSHGAVGPHCPIEVKGSWNSGLLTDLRAQLVDDYLPALHATRGIYICAWFPIEQWTDELDPRRSTAASRERQATQQDLEKAARKASTEGIRIAATVVDAVRAMPSIRAQAKRHS